MGNLLLTTSLPRWGMEFLPQRGIAYQRRATPWEKHPGHFRVLKERRISPHNPSATGLCGVPSERIANFHPVPRVAPWAGMPRPFGALAGVA